MVVLWENYGYNDRGFFANSTQHIRDTKLFYNESAPKTIKLKWCWNIRSFETQILAHIMFPLRIAGLDISPLGTRIERRDVPAFMATHVEHTMPQKHSTQPKAASIKVIKMSLRAGCRGPWDLWAWSGMVGKPGLKKHKSKPSNGNPLWPFMSIKLRLQPGKRRFFFRPSNSG